MVKQFIVIIISLLHLAAVSGATVRMHYCMGEFVDAKLLSHTEEEEDKGHSCPKCGMNQNSDNDCCKDTHKFIKDISDKAVKQQQAIEFSQNTPFLPLIQQSIISFRSKAVVKRFVALPAMPCLLGGLLPLFIEQRNIRV